MTGLLSSADVRDMIRAACVEAGSQKAYAAALGITPSVLSLVLKGHREPNETLLAAVGIVRAVAYARI